MTQSILSANSPVIVGNWATLLLTTNRDGNIDYSRLTDEIDVLIAGKLNGIYSCGTAGEFYALSETEFDAVSRLLSEKCRQSYRHLLV